MKSTEKKPSRVWLIVLLAVLAAGIAAVLLLLPKPEPAPQTKPASAQTEASEPASPQTEASEPASPQPREEIEFEIEAQDPQTTPEKPAATEQPLPSPQAIFGNQNENGQTEEFELPLIDIG